METFIYVGPKLGVLSGEFNILDLGKFFYAAIDIVSWNMTKCVAVNLCFIQA